MPGSVWHTYVLTLKTELLKSVQVVNNSSLHFVCSFRGLQVTNIDQNKPNLSKILTFLKLDIVPLSFQCRACKTKTVNQKLEVNINNREN